MTKKQSLADALAAFGMTPDVISKEDLQKQTEHDALEDNYTLEAESVIFYMETKDRDIIFKKRTCALCSSKFLSTYTNVSLCSNECRKNYFASKGMTWDPTGKTEAERWGSTIPRVIGPLMTKKLQGMTFPEEELLEKPPPVVESDDDFDIEAFIKGDI